MAFLKGHALNVSLVPLVGEGPGSFFGRSCVILFHLRPESLFLSILITFAIFYREIGSVVGD
jgi:hypothetical protein